MRTVVLAAMAWVAAAGVVDRVAVVVGNHVITESEILREVRLTELINGEPLDLGLKQRQAAADRLVDQLLIRNEMEIGNYRRPAAAEAEPMVRKFRPLLAKYGVTEEELREHVLWQIAAMRFTDQRFHLAIPGGPAQSAERSSAPAVDEMDAWLKEQRASTKVQFKKGAFQ